MNNRLPAWFRQAIPDEATLRMIRLLSEFNVHTVCKEARCPNLGRCFKNKKLTFLILGNICTRCCRFCAVGKTPSRNLTVDTKEPYRISRIAQRLGLEYVVITSVTRDDLADGGAKQFALTSDLIHGLDRNINVEVLIPDFLGSISSLRAIVGAAPSVLAHNMETVRNLYQEIRPQASYQRSLDILSRAKEIDASLPTKSSLILGLGETEKEVVEVMEDLRRASCDMLTLGQYLSPGLGHYPVKEFISIGQFRRYHDLGVAMGFKTVLSGPLVRSSYMAEIIYDKMECLREHACPEPFLFT